MVNGGRALCIQKRQNKPNVSGVGVDMDLAALLVFAHARWDGMTRGFVLQKMGLF
jgi:hypothetical protein